MMKVAEKPTLKTVLGSLSRERLYDLGRVMGAGLRETKSTKTKLVDALGAVLGQDRLPAVLHELGRDELRAVHRAHGGDGAASQRAELIEALLTASGYDPRSSWRARVSGRRRPGQEARAAVGSRTGGSRHRTAHTGPQRAAETGSTGALRCVPPRLEVELRQRVLRVNQRPAPVHHRLLCHFEYRVSSAPGLFAGADYQPLSNTATRAPASAA